MLACAGIKGGAFNRVFGVDRFWGEAGDEVKEAYCWLRKYAAEPWIMQLDPDTPEEVVQSLDRLGIGPTTNGWAKLFRWGTQLDAEHAPIDIRLAYDAGTAVDFARVVIDGFRFPAAAECWFSALSNRPNWRTYVAYEDDRPAAAAAMFVHGDQCWLGIDTTLSPNRRHGLQAALIRRRISDGIDLGVRGFTAETSKPSRHYEASGSSYRNYRSSGFELQYVSMDYAPSR
jgi:hypothetical protein